MGAMGWIGWPLFFGGVFNFVMGLVFLTDRLLAGFLVAATRAEMALFSRKTILLFPEDPLHLLLIHGFGAAALILGATLIFASRYPEPFLPFIFLDGLGRFLFGSIMVFYVMEYSLPQVILLFAAVELLLAITYLIISWKLR
jgi:hypothetical protein